MGSEEYTDPNNKWLNNAPTKGDGKSFMGGSGGSQGIDVSPDGVKQFSGQAMGEFKDFMSNFSRGVVPLAQQHAKIGPAFMEAEYFINTVTQANNRLVQFQTDAGNGLMALGTGASAIAINYINGDATSAATMSDVEHAFDTSNGTGYRNAPVDPNAPPKVTGQDAPVSLPKADYVDPRDFTRDPNAPETINLGPNDSYTIPASGPNDLERMGIQEEAGKLAQKYGDDLKDQDWTPADGGGFTPPNK